LSPDVLVTHGYPLREVARLCAAGELPRQHLWGADALAAAGFRVLLGPAGGGSRVLRHLSWRTRRALGDLDEELGILRRGPGAVTLAGEAGMVRGLAAARAAGAWRAPVVGVFHGTPAPGPAARWLRGIDVALCLSRTDRDALVERFGRAPARILHAPWGPDLGYAGYAAAATDELVVSVGRTDRDLLTLTRALAELRAPGRVYALAGEAVAPSADVEVVRAPAQVDYRQVLAHLRRAAVVAIPLPASERLLGLTELGDALALGKPVVMTANARVDVDVEAIGCGLRVAPGDVRGFRDALGALLGDPARRAAMGAAGRAFAERGWNAAAFGRTVVHAVRLAAGGPSEPAAAADQRGQV
jgi:glycosyltransferase involved in cell wall biosynthesis